MRRFSISKPSGLKTTKKRLSSKVIKLHSTRAATTVAQGTAATQNYEFQRVGMTLRGRPSITPEKNVDMIVNVILSQLTGTEKNRPAGPQRDGDNDQHDY